MTALPLPPQRLPLTVDEYIALGEEADGVRYELQEGNLVMSPSPRPEHQIALYELAHQLHDQVPGHLRVVPDVDVDLQLAPASAPGTVRAPDLVVVSRDELRRRSREGDVLRAGEIRLAIEIVSPGSRRTDTVLKRNEYADAGIPHYWVVDLGEPGDGPELTAHHLAGAFGYMDPGPVGGTFATTEPFPVRIDLDALV